MPCSIRRAQPTDREAGKEDAGHVPDREDTRHARGWLYADGGEGDPRRVVPNDQEVRSGRRLLAPKAQGLGAPEQARSLQGPHRRDARGGPPLLPQAASHGQARLREAARGAWLQRQLLHGAALHEGDSLQGAEGRVGEARMGPGHHAGRLRLCLRRRQGKDALPAGVLPVLQPRGVRGLRGREGRLRLPGAQGLL